MHAACFPLLLVLLSRGYALSSTPSGSPPLQINSRSSDPVPRRVICHYFKTAPVGTYCVLLGRNGSITGEDVEKGCGQVGMTLLSSKTTPSDRVCSLITVFALKHRNIWLADELNEMHLLKFDPCDVNLLYTNEAEARKTEEEQKAEEEEKGKFLQGNLTTLGWDCTFCNTAVICEAGFYHSNGSNCVTVEEQSGEVEYCYFTERASARDSRSRCQRRSSELMDAALLNGTENLEYVRHLVRTDLEFWVDLRKEDVADLSGVIAFNAEENAWNTSCVTVWFGRNVPWFFRRNCNESYRIICQDVTKFSNFSESYPNDKDCVYNKSNSRIFGYCIPENRTFGMMAGSEFCANQGLELLRGSTLRELYDLYGEGHPQNRDTYVVWDEGFLDEWDGTSTKVYATNLTDEWPKREMRSSLDPLGYICRQEKPRACVPQLTRENLSLVLAHIWRTNRPELCLSHENLTFQESVNYCEVLGMALLPQQLFLQYIYYSGDELFEDDVKAMWVVPQLRRRSECGAYSAHSQIELDDDCSKKHHALCTTKGAHLSPCHAEEGWWWQIYDDFREPAMVAILTNSIEEILTNLNVLKNRLSRGPDMEVIPSVLARVVDNFNRLVIRLDEDNRAAYNRRMGEALVEMAEKTTLRTTILKGFDQDFRLFTITCLVNIAEQFAIDKNLSRSL